MAKSGAERQRDRRRRLKQSGAREVTVTLDAEAQQAVQQLAREGQTLSDVIAGALLQCVAETPQAKPGATRTLEIDADGVFRPTS